MNDKKLTVAINVPVFPNIVQTYILSPIVALNKIGIDTIIISEKPGEYETPHSAIENYQLLDKVTYIQTDYAHLFYELLTLPLYNARYRNIIRNIITQRLWRRYGWKYIIKALIRAKVPALAHYDLMHSHTLTTTFNYLFIKDITPSPIVTTFHGLEPRTSNNLPADKASVVFEQGDVFIVNTRFAKQLLVDAGCSPDKIEIIPQGITLADFPFTARTIDKSSPINLISVGRLSIEKGIHVSLDALRILSDEFPELIYHIVGDGPEKGELLDFVSRNKLTNRVVFHGYRTGKVLHRIFSGAHIFVFPSIDTGDGFAVETQGVALHEAQSLGIPVIGSRTGGIPDVIKDKETGLLFDESDSHDLASNIRQLINKPELYNRLCINGRKDVELHYDSDVVCKQVADLYNGLLQ